ncbi:hypothetical protein CP02DC15_1091B, partial [Chlamydia psittaci 02DC15]
KGCGV